MIAHTQTLFGAVALVAVIMGSCLILVGQLRHRDGMLTTGLGMLSHALAYIGFTLFGLASMWLTYVLANTLLSTALAFYTVSLPLIHGRHPPWRLAFAFPLLLGVLLSLLIDTQEPRQLVACLLLFSQCLVILHLSRRHAVPGGRAHRILMIGAGISLFGLGIRVVVILSGAPVEMHYDVSNLKQTVSVALGAATIIMFSFGLVLLSRERIESELRQTALRDTLTGLPNRLAILEQLTDELERARRQHTPLSIAMLDLDHFKLINDSHGHLVGDAVLRHCANHLQQRLRRNDSIGRYGGEEFLLVLPGTYADGALELVDQLRQSLTQHPAQNDSKTIALSFSAGVYGSSNSIAEDITGMLLKADTALYRAKHAGRNTQVLATAD
ncbi:GGDEF domain-containing protein [Ectopseudomonas mendocina]|jgi:diguanylate cyclase (GGDEF)-like protein|uniref:GGDEF domain-containing protein n=1 Tax=Ectopseudomonas mendocina TaxID=300 RepID=UPI0005A82B5E|nr:GGDEF domain-containing protein [Pseudomonas mendocina]VEE13473.1 diguanylate cyclase [Pseudomonas mendocina]